MAERHAVKNHSVKHFYSSMAAMAIPLRTHSLRPTISDNVHLVGQSCMQSSCVASGQAFIMVWQLLVVIVAGIEAVNVKQLGPQLPSPKPSPVHHLNACLCLCAASKLYICTHR